MPALQWQGILLQAHPGRRGRLGHTQAQGREEGRHWQGRRRRVQEGVRAGRDQEGPQAPGGRYGAAVRAQGVRRGARREPGVREDADASADHRGRHQHALQRRAVQGCRRDARHARLPGHPQGRHEADRKVHSRDKAYLDSPRPRLSGRWRTDEMHPKVGGRKMYPCALIDDEGRFWIAASWPRPRTPPTYGSPRGAACVLPAATPRCSRRTAGRAQQRRAAARSAAPAYGARPSTRAAYTRPATGTTTRWRSLTGSSGTGKRSRGR